MHIATLHRSRLATGLALALGMPSMLFAGSPSGLAIQSASTLADRQPLRWESRAGRGSPSSAIQPRTPASTIVVQNCNDEGAGSLRDAVQVANSGDAIDLTQLQCSSITLGTGTILMAQDDLTLNGPGAAALAIHAGYTYQENVIFHAGTGTLAINNLSVQDGRKYQPTVDALGGCLYSAGNMVLDGVYVYNCSARQVGDQNTYGGALFARGSLTVTSSYIGNSTAYARRYAVGGGLYAGNGLTLTNSTVNDTSAVSNGGYSYGGGIFALGTISITGSTIAYCSAQQEGAIAAFGTEAAITNSTITHNIAVFMGGIGAATPISISNSTIADNVATQYGFGGVTMASGVHLAAGATIVSSILSGNTSGNAPADLSGSSSSTVSGDHNDIMRAFLAVPAGTIDDDPLLAPLHYNGGPTKTRALVAGSPAVDAGSDAGNFDYDQRGPGFARVSGPQADIGAFEYQVTLSAPTLSKQFAPATISVGGTSTLVLVLSNTNTTPATLLAPLTDTLPSPVVIASPPNVTTTCAEGTVTAAAGDSAVTLEASAQIPAGGACTVTVSVTASSGGTFTNVIPAGSLHTDAGDNASDATAPLMVTVTPIAPTVAKAFAPDAIAVGADSTLTITLANPNAGAATLTQALIDTLPSPMVVASQPNASTTCPDGIVTAAANAHSVTLAATAQIPANASCTISVSVSADTDGNFTNVIAAGALQTDVGSSAVDAIAVLTVSDSPADTVFADGFEVP